eukprot:TRINITY_DN57_c0_g1_i1.p6 TRINITY_DN57_c0_g1~~TRINITY_DN57_c0_g1_i1.p6  ORF type:complete len:373 (+),score=66.00 TRINITY_DN57_c0_g1_i1:108-1226(+)
MIRSTIGLLAKVRGRGFAWMFKKPPEAKIPTQKSKIDPKSEKVMQRKAQEFLKMFSKDPSILKNPSIEANLIPLLQNLSKYATLPATLIRDAEKEILANVSGMTSAELLEVIVVYAIISKELPRQVLYELSTKISLLNTKQIARLLYFSPGLGNAKIKEMKDLGIVKYSCKVLEEEMLTLGGNELYMAAMGCSEIEVEPETLKKLFTTAVEKETQFTPHQIARLYRIWHKKTCKFSPRGFTDKQILDNLKYIKYPELGFLLQCMLEDPKKMSMQLKEGIQKEVLYRLNEGTAFDVCKAIVGFDGTDFTKELAKKVEEYLEKNAHKMEHKVMLEILGCLEKYNKKQEYTNIIKKYVLDALKNRTKVNNSENNK